MKSLGQIEFKQVSAVDDLDKAILSNCDFKFPMGLNCRIVSDEHKHASLVLQIMSNLGQIKKGSIFYNDTDVKNLSFEEFLPWQLNMSYGFDSSALLSNRTLEQNLSLPILFHNRMPEQQGKEWVLDLLNRFEIFKFKDFRPAEVSPFVRKAALIARAFVMKNETVFLDEPDVSLDKSNFPVLLDLVDELRKNSNLKNIFFCTQNEELAECLLTAAVKQSGGKLKTIYVHKNYEQAVGL